MQQNAEHKDPRVSADSSLLAHDAVSKERLHMLVRFLLLFVIFFPVLGCLFVIVEPS